MVLVVKCSACLATSEWMCEAWPRVSEWLTAASFLFQAQTGTTAARLDSHQSDHTPRSLLVRSRRNCIIRLSETWRSIRPRLIYARSGPCSLPARLSDDCCRSDGRAGARAAATSLGRDGQTAVGRSVGRPCVKRPTPTDEPPTRPSSKRLCCSPAHHSLRHGALFHAEFTTESTRSIERRRKSSIVARRPR